MKIEIDGDDLAFIADLLALDGRRMHSAYCLRLAARLYRELGLTATAGSIEAERDRLAAAEQESEPNEDEKS
jgi:hypothetical protein